MENAEEIVDEICEALVGNIEEPAGSGCGYGVTEEGLAEILEVIKRILPQKEKESIMSTVPTYAAVKRIGNYKVTAIETAIETHEETNMIVTEAESVLLDEKLFKASTQQLAEFAALKECEKMEGVDMVNIKVTSRPFPG
jgi:hypothetical protein